MKSSKKYSHKKVENICLFQVFWEVISTYKINYIGDQILEDEMDFNRDQQERTVSQKIRQDKKNSL